VLIAQIAGRVARHHNDGIGIEFVGQKSPPNRCLFLTSTSCAANLPRAAKFLQKR